MRRRPRVRLEPLFSGGGQERGLRSGTLSPALCVGMGAAARVCAEEMRRDTEWISFLSERLKKYAPTPIQTYIYSAIDIIHVLQGYHEQGPDDHH